MLQGGTKRDGASRSFTERLAPFPDCHPTSSSRKRVTHESGVVLPLGVWPLGAAGTTAGSVRSRGVVVTVTLTAPLTPFFWTWPIVCRAARVALRFATA